MYTPYGMTSSCIFRKKFTKNMLMSVYWKFSLIDQPLCIEFFSTKKRDYVINQFSLNVKFSDDKVYQMIWRKNSAVMVYRRLGNVINIIRPSMTVELEKKQLFSPVLDKTDLSTPPSLIVCFSFICSLIINRLISVCLQLSLSLVNENRRRYISS